MLQKNKAAFINKYCIVKTIPTPRFTITQITGYKNIKELQEKDSRIKLVCLEKNSGGPAHPKNRGFEVSVGEFIAYLDQDDEWLPNKLQEQINLFNNSFKKEIASGFSV